MHTTGLSRWLLAALTVAAITSFIHADPPALPAPGSDTDAMRTALDRRARYWLKKIQETASISEVYEAQKGLISDFRQALEYDITSDYTNTVSNLATVMLTGGLKASDPLKTAKEVNIALSVSKMPELAALPAIKAMSSNSSQAVRYFACSALSGLRGQVLTQGEDELKSMLALLAKIDASTPSPGVARSLYDALNFGTNVPAGVPDALQKKAAAGSVNLMARTWNDRCGKLITGDVDWAQAVIRATSSLAHAGRRLEASPKAKRVILQMLLDALYCAAIRLDESLKDLADATADGNAKAALKARAVQAAMTNLLVSGEMAIQRISDVDLKPITKVVRNPGKKDLGAEVRVPIIKDWPELLKGTGVKRPDASKFPKPKPRAPRVAAPKDPSAPAPAANPARPDPASRAQDQADLTP